MCDGCAHVADGQHQTRQDALHHRGRVGAIAFARARGEIGLIGGGLAQQRSDVVGQHLGGHVDDQRLLAQPRDGFEVQAMLEPFECFFNAPALVIEIGEGVARMGLRIQVGQERAELAVRRGLAYQAQPGRLARAAPVAHFIGAGCAQPLNVTQASAVPERRNFFVALQPLGMQGQFGTGQIQRETGAGRVPRSIG